MLEMIAFHRDEPLGGIVDGLVHAGIDIPAREAPEIHGVVAELAENAGLPKPRVYVIPTTSPNACRHDSF